MDWDKLKGFYYVAHLKSFSKAAQHMRLSQPSVSRQIQSLEEKIGKKLFKRNTKQLGLTPQGEALYKIVKRVFLELDSVEKLLYEESLDLKGTLKIATSVGLATTWLMPMIPGFVEKYPQIRLTITSHDDNLDLSLRHADIVIRPYVENRSEVIQKPIVTFNFRLYASKAYLKKFGTPQSVDDLAAHRLIAFGEEIAYPYSDINWLLRLGMPEGHLREPFMRVNSAQALHYVVKAGLGIVSLSKEHEQTEFAHPDVIQILPEIHGATIPTYLIYPCDLNESKNLQAFIGYLEEKLKKDKTITLTT